MTRTQLVLAGVTLAVALALAVFGWVRQEYGPGDYDSLRALGGQPGFIATYLCDNPACRYALRAAPEEEKRLGLDPWQGANQCPRCGRQSLRRAERCTSCGELVPSPPPDKLLRARCPRCGKELFGPLGGLWPTDPQRPKREPGEADDQPR